MKWIRWTTYVFAALLAFTLSRNVFAQTARAQVQGLVTDSSGAVVPNATVTLSNVGTGVSTVRKTSNTGLYVFDLVQPGNYTITVEAAGFPKFTQPSIQVQSGGDVTVNAVLSIGALQQTVTVNASAEELQFNSANNELTIDTKDGKRYAAPRSQSIQADLDSTSGCKHPKRGATV